MKKLFLIIAVALLSATSAFAYSGCVSGANQNATYSANTKSVSYYLQFTGQGTCHISASGTYGASFTERIWGGSVAGSFKTGNGTITSIFMEVFAQQIWNGSQVQYLGNGSVQANW